MRQEQDFIKVLQSFINKAEELNIVWRREADDLFVLQVYLKTNGKILIKNELYFSKETVVTDLSKVLDLIIKALLEAAPGINLKIDGIPGIDSRLYTVNELLKPVASSDFTLIKEEDEECDCDDYNFFEHCHCCGEEYFPEETLIRANDYSAFIYSETDKMKMVLKKIVDLINENL